jgi:hypothetical protein
MSGSGQRGRPAMSGGGQRGRPARFGDGDGGKRGVLSMPDNDQGESPSMSGGGLRGVLVEKVFEVIVGDWLIRDVFDNKVC